MTTPIIAGFYPDPSICRVGDAYYVACSSFEYSPGVPIHRSTDLVTWTQVGNALQPSQLDVRAAPASSTRPRAPDGSSSGSTNRTGTASLSTRKRSRRRS